jgi:hypothetical protein
MPRSLTSRETAVLAHVVVNPVAWWTHACSRDGSDGNHAINAEAALAAKVEKRADQYDAELAARGADYQTRAERDEVTLAAEQEQMRS